MVIQASGFIDGMENVSNFSSFWIVMVPITATVAKENILLSFYGESRVSKDEWKIYGGILFCWFDSWLFQVSCFSVFYSSYLKTTHKNPKPILWWKKNNNIKQLLSFKVLCFQPRTQTLSRHSYVSEMSLGTRLLCFCHSWQITKHQTSSEVDNLYRRMKEPGLLLSKLISNKFDIFSYEWQKILVCGEQKQIAFFELKS